jgi:hypothetical protein
MIAVDYLAGHDIDKVLELDHLVLLQQENDAVKEMVGYLDELFFEESEDLVGGKVDENANVPIECEIRVDLHDNMGLVDLFVLSCQDL